MSHTAIALLIVIASSACYLPVFSRMVVKFIFTNTSGMYLAIAGLALCAVSLASIIAIFYLDWRVGLVWVVASIAIEYIPARRRHLIELFNECHHH